MKYCHVDARYCHTTCRYAIIHAMSLKAIRHLEKLRDETYFKQSGLPCVMREMRYAPSNAFIAMHDHEFSELVIVASGGLKHIHANETTLLKQGDFFVIHPGERHGYAELAPRTLIFNLLYHASEPPFGSIVASNLFPVLFPIGDTYPPAKTLGRVPRHELAHVVGLVREIRREEESKRPLRHVICSTLLIAIMLELSRWAHASAPPGPENIQKELDFISLNLARKITLKDICDVSERSVSTLHRAFRRIVGTSPMDYVISMRLAKARILLERGGLSMEEVAAQTGFCSASHLSHTLHARQAQKSP